MANCRIVLADNDLSYLATIELELLRQFGDRAQVELITDTDYLRDCFSVSQRIDVLIMNEALWLEDYRRQDIGQVFLLTESEERNDKLEYPQIYKYTSVQSVLKTISNAVVRALGGESSACRVIAVYSPQGGCGKTSVAIGLASVLASFSGHVLFLSAEALPDFGPILGASAGMDDAMLHELKRERISSATLKRNIHSGLFDWVLPMRHVPESYSLTERCFQTIIQQITAEQMYDYVIVDTCSNFDADKAALLTLADRVVVPLLQNRNGHEKLRVLANNLDLSDREKFAFVYNAWKAGGDEPVMDADLPIITDTIPVLPQSCLSDPAAMRESGAYLGLAYRLL